MSINGNTQALINDICIEDQNRFKNEYIHNLNDTETCNIPSDDDTDESQ